MIRWLVALALLSSCSSVTNEGPRYLALGDSYTIGEGVAEEERFPNQLARELGWPAPQIIARTGWTTDELSAAIDTAKPKGPFDLVTVLIGVNNQYRGREAEQYRGELAVLLQRAIGFAGGDPNKVIVVSIPDWGVTPFAEGRDRAKIAREIDQYNRVNFEEATRARAKYVHITTLSRSDDPAMVAGDGLHPSGEQYAKWVRVIAAAAKPRG